VERPAGELSRVGHPNVLIVIPGGKLLNAVAGLAAPFCASFTALRKSLWNCWGLIPMD
jgi:hypothetical protein